MDYSDCATVCTAHVALGNNPEDYKLSQAYRTQKTIIKQVRAKHGKCKLWDVMRQLYKFAEPLDQERECREIVLIPKDHPNTARSLWKQGDSLQLLDYCLTNRGWKDRYGTPGVRPGDTLELRFAVKIQPLEESTTQHERLSKLLAQLSA